MDLSRCLSRPILAGATLVAATAVTQVVAAPAATAAVPGLQIVSAVTTASSASPKSVVATCPTGTRVIGTGVYVDGVVGQVFVDDLVPGTTTVRATGYEDQDGTAADWWLRAYAVCANPLPGLQVVAVTSAASSTNKSAAAACPTGRTTLGTGAEITGGLGQVTLGTMLPAGSSGLATAYEDADGTTANWTVTSYAICATAPAGLVSRDVKTATDSADKAAWPACPAGTRPLSLGWQIVGPEPGRITVDIAAYAASNDAVIVAHENGPDVLSGWLLNTRIVCASP